MQREKHEKNLKRCLDAMKKYGIETEGDLEWRLASIDVDLRVLFKTKWGINGQPYCPTFRHLAERMREPIPSVRMKYYIAEAKIAEMQYYDKYLTDYVGINHEDAMIIGNILTKAGIKTKISGKKLQLFIRRNLKRKEATILEDCVGKDLRLYRYYAERWGKSITTVKEMEQAALKEIKDAYERGELE